MSNLLKHPPGYQTCNVMQRSNTQISHLVRVVGRGTPGPTVCGLTRFDDLDGSTVVRPADLPGWSMGGGVFGPKVTQRKCPGCWEES